MNPIDVRDFKRASYIWMESIIVQLALCIIITIITIIINIIIIIIIIIQYEKKNKENNVTVKSWFV